MSKAEDYLNNERMDDFRSNVQDALSSAVGLDPLCFYLNSRREIIHQEPLDLFGKVVNGEFKQIPILSTNQMSEIALINDLYDERVLEIKRSMTFCSTDSGIQFLKTYFNE